jgi:hypothetical protein
VPSDRKPLTCGIDRTAVTDGNDSAEANPGQSTQIAEYSVPEEAGLRNLGSHRLASFGSRGTVLLEAADGSVVALAARRCWFCYHQLFAVLLRFERRRPGLAELAALHWAFSWTRVSPATPPHGITRPG